jgi:hypothetical protein
MMSRVGELMRRSCTSDHAGAWIRELGLSVSACPCTHLSRDETTAKVGHPAVLVGDAEVLHVGGLWRVFHD